jgi:hypothetical protein
MSDDKRKKAEAAIMQYINGLFGRTEGYARAVSRHFTTAVNALLDLAAKADMAPDEVFYFADDKRLSAKATAILRGLYSAVYQEIRNGVIAEWGNANAATDLMLTRLFGKGLKEDNHFARWFARNQEAMDSFFSRKDVHGGLNLSQKVWKYTSQFKEEMELALSASLGRGDSAATVSRHVRQYLQEPERLFRRVRDAKGNLKLSKRAAAYHPGRGEYRSSYKNAMRLARTETNAAYRAADCDRWGSIPFVVGMEVKRSNHPFGCEVCELLKGKYPKDFVFTGWHPQCRCYIVPVLADEKERMAYHRAVLNGEDVSDWHFKGEITEPHEGFKKWIGENQERIGEARQRGTLPYWIKDNETYLAKGRIAVVSNKTYLGGMAAGEIGTSQISKEDRIFMNNVFNEIQSKLNIFAPGTYISTGEMDGGVVMECLPGMVRVTRVKYLLEDGTVFSPAEELLSAMKKLKSGEAMTFNEEYMIESLYHESVHSITGVVISKLERNTIHEKLMETCNQLYARNNYTSILKAYNVDAKNYEKIQLQGICYQRECAVLRKAFVNGNVLDDKMLLQYANRTKNIYDLLEYLEVKGMTKEVIKDIIHQLIL